MKGLKKLKVEEVANNMLKKLNYISNINKNQKDMNIMLQQSMKNLNISFNDNNIKYEEYYFNGLSLPKDIQINDIKYNSCNISWKIDDNIDKNKIKYKIEIRKENKQFNSIYENNNMNYNINKLESNTNYEIRLCTI